jgi:hypothetical protein
MEDKSLLGSLTNQGSFTSVIGALLLLVGEPLSKGIKPEPVQLIGYGILFAGIIMYQIGNRRARGKVINGY